MNLALFDFDGTITRSDSLLDFTRFTLGSWQVLRTGVRLIPSLLAYAVKRINNQEMKIRFLTAFFQGFSLEAFQEAGQRYCRTRLSRIMNPRARARIQWHLGQGDQVVVVTASAEEWIAPWCRELGLGIIATRLEIVDNRLTGKLASPNCYGPQKVERIRAALDLSRYGRIFAYGDSRGDREMLALADEKHYRFF
jgi:HAD superfamily hydrolase (TIGR01490 family)